MNSLRSIRRQGVPVRKARTLVQKARAFRGSEAERIEAAFRLARAAARAAKKARS